MATGKAATQSSTRGSAGAAFALDGDLITASQTERMAGPQWWRVDLGDKYFIQTIYVHVFNENWEGKYHK